MSRKTRRIPFQYPEGFLPDSDLPPATPAEADKMIETGFSTPKGFCPIVTHCRGVHCAVHPHWHDEGGFSTPKGFCPIVTCDVCQHRRHSCYRVSVPRRVFAR